MTQVEFFNAMVEKVMVITGWDKNGAQQSVANYIDRKNLFERVLNLNVFTVLDEARKLSAEFGF